MSRPLIKERWQNIQCTGWNLYPPAQKKKDQITSSQSQDIFRTVDSRLVILSHFIHQFLIFFNFSLSSTVSFGLHHDLQKETSFLFWHNDHTNSACIWAVRHQDNKPTFLRRHLVVKYMRATCYSTNWWHSSFFKKSSSVCVLNCCFYHLLKNAKFKFRRRNWLDYSAVRRICWLVAMTSDCRTGAWRYAGNKCFRLSFFNCSVLLSHTGNLRV